MNEYGVVSRLFSPELMQPVAAIPFDVTGVDVSYWQGDIDWEILATKAKFAYIRAGSGNNYIDGKLERNVLGALDNGVPFGLYWYLKPAKDFKQQADNFAAAVGIYGGNLYPAFDLEESGGLDKAALDSWMGKLVIRFRSNLGLELNQCTTYTSPGFLNTAMPLTNYLKWTNLWVAHWTTAPEPLRPNEWLIPDKPWKFWQFSAKGDGLSYGAQSRAIDLNRYNGTLAQFIDEFGATPPTPPPPPPPPAEFPKMVKVKSSATPFLNLRDAPDGADIGDLYPGTVVTVIGKDGDWLHVRDGYIHKDYVEDA